MFDSDPHQRLLRTSLDYGIRRQLLSWIKYFLTETRQYISVKSKALSWEKCFFFCFFFLADDTKIYNEDSNGDILQNILMHCLCGLSYGNFVSVLINIRLFNSVENQNYQIFIYYAF